MAQAEHLPASLAEFPTGIHRNVPAEFYHRRVLGLVSKGALEALDRSPKHYRAWLEEPDGETAALTFGKAFHCALLEPSVFESTYCVAPEFGDCRLKENKAARDEWRKAHVGFTEMPAGEFDMVRRMADSIRSHELGALIMRDGEPELTLTWTDDETGLRCKTRPDYHVKSQRMCVDVKTTMDARDEHFARDAAKYDYPLQDALYRDGFRMVEEPVEHFVFLAVEKIAPFDVAIHTLDRMGVNRGYTRARQRMGRLAECLKTNKWPGYYPTINTIEMPPWYI